MDADQAAICSDCGCSVSSREALRAGRKGGSGEGGTDEPPGSGSVATSRESRLRITAEKIMFGVVATGQSGGKRVCPGQP